MGGTSKEGITEQHDEALRMIKSCLPCAAMVNRGEIPLKWKLAPTIENPFYSKTLKEESKASQETVEAEMKLDESMEIQSISDIRYENGSCISSRGQVDVSKIVNLVNEGCQEAAPVSQSTSAKLKATKVQSLTNLWDEVNAATNNVHVCRPSHDAWGIKKIVLIFCDDFLQTIYEMPWWHKKLEMRQAVQPILDALNVDSRRIVRMLFAALPPGVTIPVHHDTGSWVKKTHRVHVPIVVNDPNRVLFRCGPTESSMQRINCTPGHVFEMNNQGKHAVSNCQDEYRVHLILDYADPPFHINTRIKLDPGETLLQTRRSIDRATEKGKRPTPSYMILGAQKSGTTSIYEYINQHSLAVRAKRRETHCLDWRWRSDLNTKKERQQHCLNFFLAKELKFHPSCLTGDSTPSYLLDSYRCISRLKQVFPHAMKFIVIFRDPTKRAKSHFEMVTSLDGTPEQIENRGKEWINFTIEEVIELDLRNMKESGLIPYWNNESKTIDMELFRQFVGSKQEDEAFTMYMKDHIPMGNGSHSLVSRGLYELQLRQWMRSFPPDSFLALKLEDMKVQGVNETMKKVWKHLELPEFEVEDESAKNTRAYSELNGDTREMLERFYEPHNARLESLLGEEWSNPW
jgi:hypothetical protein